MKKHALISQKHLLYLSFPLLVFVGITFFLFAYQKDEKQFAHITSRLFVEEMKSSTLNMHYTIASPTDFGIYNYEPRLPLYEPSEELTNQAVLENTLAALHDIDPNKLSASSAYTYTLLERSLTNSLQRNQYPYYSEPLSPSSGMQSQLPILLAEYSFRCKQDIEDYLALLEQTDDYYASLLLYEQEKSDAGLLMPASSMKKVRKQCDTIVTMDELENNSHFLQKTFEERLNKLVSSGDITVPEAAHYTSLNNRLLKTVLCPAYEMLSDGLFLLEDDDISLAGLAAKPKGKEYYQYLLISETGSYRPLSDIKRLLTQQLRLESNEIRAIIQENPALTTYLAAEDYTMLPKEDGAAMLADLQVRMQDSFPAFPGNDSSMPSVTVKNVSKSLEQYTAPAFYLTPPIDATDTNVIYINQKNSPAGLELYTTLAHEGYPGHLYQTVYSNLSFLENQENKVRQLLWYGGYLEGWALYVEFLSYDYASTLLEEQHRPEDALCVQIEKHNRSLQLCLYSIIDIMIHYENASLAQVTKLLQNFGINNPGSAAAIFAYIAEEPCNYLKYYLGYLEILELQSAAKAQWGDSYTDYSFHRFYLDCGPSDFTSLAERLKEASRPCERTDSHCAGLFPE